MKARIARFFDEAPVLFIGLVVVIAVVFRVGIGAVKEKSPGASADPEEKPTPVVHTPIATTPAVATPAVKADPTPSTTAPARMPEPEKPMLPKRKPRVYGKR